MTYCKDKEKLSEFILRKMIITVMVLALLIPIISPEVFAASSVTISGGDNVKGGDTFTVAVTFGGGDIGRVDASMTYDTEMLTYISGGSSTGNTGYIQLKEAGTDGSITFNIKFQALTEGSASLQVTTSEMYDMNEVYMSEKPSASKTVSISGSAASEQVITQTTSPDQPVAETELIGVDEKPDGESGEGAAAGSGKTLLMIAIIAIPIILIIIIAIILAKKKAAGKASKANEAGTARRDDTSAGMETEPTAGVENGDGAEIEFGGYRSAESPDLSNSATASYDSGFNYDSRRGEFFDEHDEGDKVYGNDRCDFRSRHLRHEAEPSTRKEKAKQKRSIKKKASEETENWSDWKGFDDNDL